MKEGLVILLLAVLVFQAGKGQEQILCYVSQQDCTLSVNSTVAASARDCCLGDGVSFRTAGNETCEECVVFGWLNGTTFEGLERGDPYTLTVGFIKGTFLSVSQLTVNVTADTAEEDFDFTAAQQQVSVGDAPVEVQVFLRADRRALEPDEQFQLRLETDDALQNNEFLQDTIIIIIVDNDTVVLQFAESDYESNEEQGRIVTLIQRLGSIATDLVFRVVLRNYTQVNVSGVFLAEDIPAVPNFDEDRPNIAKSFADFDASPIMVTIVDDGLASANIFVPIAIEDDTINEAEQVFVAFIEVSSETRNPAAVRVLRNSTLLRITDNDPIRIGFERRTYTFEETSFNTIFVIKENNQTSEQTFEVLVEVFDPVLDGFPGAIFDVEYDIGEINPDSRLGRSQRLIFDPDEQMIRFNFDLFGDDMIEGTEVFAANIALDVGAVLFGDGNITRAFVFILDDVRITVGFENTSIQVLEDVIAFDVCIRIFDISEEEILPFDFFLDLISSDGTAGGDDYVRITSDNNPLVRFNAAVTRQCFQAEIIDDSLLEERENFTFSLTLEPSPLPPLSMVLVDPDVIVIEILDNDFVQIGFEEIEYTVLESEGVAVVVVAVLNGTTTTEVTVALSTLNGSAVAPFDFSEISDMLLVFNENVTRISVSIPIAANDEQFEPPEVFQADLSLVSPQHDSITIAPSVSSVTILDQVVIGFDPAFYNVSESDGEVLLTVRVLRGELGRPVEVNFSTDDGVGITAALDPDDYTSITNFTLTFDSSTISQTVRVIVANDSLVEFNEHFFGSLATADLEVQLLPDEAEVTIIDDDRVTIGFRPVSYTVEEEDRFVIVSSSVLQGTLERSVVVNFSTMPGTASLLDFNDISMQLMFTPIILVHNVTIPITDDTIVEGIETFTATLTSDSNSPIDLDPPEADISILDNADRVTIGFEQTSYTVEEGLVVEVCVLVTSGTLEREATVMLSSVNDEAVAPGDYDAVAEVLIFSASVNRICRNVSSVEDAILEEDEDFTLTLTTTDGSVDLSPDEANVTIIDDDRVTIGFEQTTYTVEEGLVVEVCVLVTSGTLQRDATVILSSIDDGAVAPGDYDVVAEALTFSASVNRICRNASSVEDDILEEDEEFTLTLTTTDGSVDLNPDEANVTIIDDDRVTIGFEQTSYTVEEGLVVEVCVLVTSGTLEREATVMLSSANDEAVAPGDYDAVAEVLTFSASVNQICRNVSAVEDAILEEDEDFTLTLTTTDGSVDLNPDEARVTIIDDDRVTIGFEQTTYTVEEGLVVEVCVLVTSGTLESDATVVLSSVNDEAVAPGDYDAVEEFLTFSASVNQICRNVSSVEDNILEEDEDFTLTLTTTDGSIDLNPDEARVIIIDDDRVTIGFEQTAYTVEEGLVVEVCVLVTSGTLQRDATVVLSSIDDEAVAPVDYDAVAEVLTFSASVTRICRNVSSVEDDILEEDEDFTLTLTTTDGSVDLNPDEANVTIINEDRVTVGFEQTTYTVEEGLVVEVCVLVTSGALQRDATVILSSVNDEAVAPGDYDAVVEFLTFSASVNRICRNVSTVEDAILEEDEDFTLTLTTTDGSVDLNPDEATVTIIDDDRVTIGFEQTAYTVEEGLVVEVCVLVTSGTLESDATVILSSVNDEAVAPGDYDVVADILTFSASVNRICRNVSSVEDDILEEDEDFTLTLTTTDGSVNLNPDEANVTIIDDDRVTIGFEQTSYTVEEGLVVEVCVLVTSGTLQRDATVILSSINDEAVAPGDYDAVVEFLTFSANVNRICRNVSSVEDDILEEDEDFTLTLTTTDGSVNLSPNEANVTIIDDDRVTIGFEQTAYTVEEGLVVEVCVLVTSGTLEREATVILSSVNDEAVAPGDYDAVVEFLTFSASVNRICRNVSSLEDDILEEDEDFTLTLTTTDGNVNLNPDEANVTIIDDDRVTIGFEQTTYTVEEGLVVEVCVLVTSGTLESDATVMLSSVNDEAVAPGDYDTLVEILIFSASVNRICRNVSTVEDNIFEEDEDFTLTLTTTDGSVDLNPDEATVTIINDDRVTIGFEQTAYTVEEGLVVEVCVLVTSGTLEREATVMLSSVNDEAIAPGDYDTVAEVLTFSTSVNRVCRNVSSVEDDILEEDEDFTLTLTTTDGSVDLNPDEANVIIIDDDRVTIGFEQTAYTVEEGLVVEVCVLVTSGILQRDATVILSSVNDQAVAPGDYDAVAEVLTFSTSVNRVCRNVSSVEDDIFEEDEDFTLTLTTTDGSVDLNPDEANVTIIDDDRVTIGFEQTTYTVEEGLVVEVCVLVTSGILERDAIVLWSSINDEAVAPGDYDAAVEILIFSASVNRICINVSSVQDDILEEDEDFTLTLTTTDGSVDLNPDEATVTIIDDDRVTIGFEQTSYTVEEGLVVEVCVLVTSGTLESDATVMLSSINDEAVAPGDYDAVADVLIFSASVNRICRNVSSAEDDILEEDEDFTLTLTTTDGSVNLSPDEATVTIINDDRVTIGFEQTAYTVEEGLVVEVCVLVTSGTLERDATVVLSSSNDEAVAPGDYDAVIEILIFSASMNRICRNVSSVEDDILEEDEDFTLTLTTTDGSVNLNPDEASVTIINDDRVVIGFDPARYTVSEDDGEVFVTVRVLQGTLERPAVVTLSTANGRGISAAVATDDYTAIISLPLMFDANDTFQTVRIIITDDSIVEFTEHFFASLTTVDPFVDLMPEEARVNILDDDRVTIGFLPVLYTVQEEDGFATVSATVLQGTLARAVLVEFDTTTGTAGQLDFTATSVQLIFGPIVSVRNISIPITDDSIVESVETFFGTLTSDTDQPVDLNPSQAEISILDNVDRVTIGFEQTAYTVEEGLVVEVCVLVTSGTLEREATVMLSNVNDEAVAPGDYDAVSEDLTFSASTTRICRNVSSVEDDILEEDEDFTLTLTTTDGSVELSPDEARVIITDDDRVTIGFEQTSYTVEEGLVVEVCVLVTSGTLERNAIVTLSSINDEAVAPGDYDAISDELTFSASTTRICRNVSSVNDTFPESDEDFILSLTTTDGGINLTPDEASVTIMDDDDRPTEPPIIVNDTVVADPLMTVPLRIENTTLLGLNADEIVSLCYELHGEDDAYFNLVSDGCVSVNAHYITITPDLDINIIDAITVRAVDVNGSCQNIAVDLQGCTLSINGVTMDQYSSGGITVRRYNNRIRISVPNCADQDLVMWVMCLNGTLQHPETSEYFTAEMIRFVIARGFSLNEKSHGILGQFWNIPVEVEPYTGVPINETGVFTVTVNHPDSEARSFLGSLFGLTWERERRPCLYAGNREAGRADVVEDPNDSIIQGSYTDYRVSGAFATSFIFSQFEESRC